MRVSEVGQSIHESLIASSKTQKAKCKGCGSSLELYELDFRRSSKVMRCTRCGMLHMYKKDIIGKWRLFKAQKAEVPSR
jgi:ribosomal protein S27E